MSPKIGFAVMIGNIENYWQVVNGWNDVISNLIHIKKTNVWMIFLLKQEIMKQMIFILNRYGILQLNVFPNIC